MNNNTNSTETNNNIICEAIGCCAKATNRVAVKVGHEGTVALYLCDDCRPKLE
jgi:hypothetical protein